MNLRKDTTYVFEITTDTLSTGGKRFQLIINQDTSLAVKLISFSGVKATNGSQLQWTAKNEENYTHFTVERSTDNGVSYQIIGGFPSTGDRNYSLLDRNPAVTKNMYRLKLEDLNGAISYSNIVTLIYGNNAEVAKSPITLYPNPASSMINLNINLQTNLVLGNNQINSSANSAYSINIINAKGQIVKSTNITQLDWQTSVSNLLPGTYILQVVDSNKNAFIGRTTFVKL